MIIMEQDSVIYLVFSVCVCVCVCSVIQMCLCDLMDYSSPGSSVHGIFQARILEWFAISSSIVCIKIEKKNKDLFSI